MASKPVNIVVKGDYNDKDLKRAAADIKALQAASMSMGARMQNVGSQMQDFGRSVSKVGKSMTVGVTLPIVGVGVAATKMAMDFDTSLTKMVSLVGLTRGEVDGMRGDIIEMASQYGKSAKEAADAMFFITSAGLRGSDAMDTLEASLKGAAIGLGDVQTIADLATSAMNAYGPSVLSAGKATSILRTAVEQGKLESSELAGAMGSVLPIASALGVNFDEVAAAMAAMSRTGTNAAQASTQVRGILSQIAKESPKGAKALKSVGLSYEGLRKQLKEEGLLATLQTLVKAFDGNTVATSAFFGNVRALTGVMDLLGPAAQTTEDIFGTLAATTAEDLNPAFDAAADTTGFKLQKAFATLKNSLIEFGDVIAPFVAQFADKIGQLGQAFQNLSPQTKQFIVQGLAIAAAIGPVLLVVGKLIIVIGGVIKIVGVLVAAFNPVTLAVAAVVIGIGLLVAAFKLAWDSSGTLRKAVGELLATVKNIARVIVSDLVAAFRSIVGEGTDLRSILERVRDIAGPILTRVVQGLTTAFNVLGNAVRAGIKIFEGAYKVIELIVNLIKLGWIVTLDVLLNKLGPISTAFRGMANGVKAALSALVSGVAAAFNTLGKRVEFFINLNIKAINALIDVYNALASKLGGVSTMTKIAEFRFQNLSAAAQGAGTSANNIANAVGGYAGQALRATDTTNNLANSIGGYAGQVIRGNAAVEAGTLGLNGFTGAVEDVGSGVEDLLPDLDGAGKGVKKTGDESETAAKKLEKFKSKFAEVAGALKKAREDIERDYTGMVTTVTNAIMGALDFNAALPEVDENGERVGKTFIEKLQAQAELATGFAARIRTLIAEGLSLEAIQMVVAAGVTAGTKIADELIDGGATAIDETNRLIESTQLAANAIGVDAADHFFGAGLALAKQTEDAFTKRFGEGGPGYNKLNRLMNHLARSLERTSVITVVTRHVSEGIPGRRMGGPVAAGSPYIVGEAGPELFVPTMTGQIIPNHDLRTSMTGRGGAASVASGGSVINLTVNAGMGTQGAEVGRQIVDALKAYERRNGSVYVAA
jgi:TP901 family phage tail tape measure protein